MTTIGMHYDVISGKEQEFQTSFYQVLDLLNTLAGHIRSNLYQDVKVPGSYVILSEWQSVEQFKVFVKSDAFAKVTAWGKAEILRDRPRHKIYTHD